MAMGKMSTFGLFVFACALAGLCHGQDEACTTKVEEVISKVMACVTKKHPEYWLMLLGTMKNFKNPGNFENPDFMCKNEKLMATMVQCGLEYVEGCMPQMIAAQVAEVMPSEKNIKAGVHFLCTHRNDFDDPCVNSKLTQLGQCISSKMQTYSSVTKSSMQDHNMRGALCLALNQEEKCLDSSLGSCRPEVTTDIKQALRAFFPSDKCLPRTLPQVLHFQSEGRH